MNMSEQLQDLAGELEWIVDLAGHDVVFLERDQPWYADNRDLPKPPYGKTELYASLEDLKDRFESAVRRADFVMVGHLIDTDVEASGLPSSLSPEWINGVLRGELGYEGVVISDDLEMGAIRDHFKLEEAVVKAVQAGMDVLLFSNTANYHPGLGDEVREILVNAANADPAFRARIEESYARIISLKQRIGS